DDGMHGGRAPGRERRHAAGQSGRRHGRDVLTALTDNGIARILMPGRKAPEEHRRKDILRAAYDVAARHGVEGVTVRAVAGRAAVSHGTVLFHFNRRDELIASLLDRVLDATTVLRIPAEAERLTRPAQRLRA